MKRRSPGRRSPEGSRRRGSGGRISRIPTATSAIPERPAWSVSPIAVTAMAGAGRPVQLDEEGRSRRPEMDSPRPSDDVPPAK